MFLGLGDASILRTKISTDFRLSLGLATWIRFSWSILFINFNSGTGRFLDSSSSDSLISLDVGVLRELSEFDSSSPSYGNLTAPILYKSTL